MALIDDIKLSLKIKTIAINTDVQDLIDSAKADLHLCGILQSKIDTVDTEEPDVLIKRCINLYSKANFGLENIDSEKYQARYDKLKTNLALSQKYTVEAVV